MLTGLVSIAGAESTASTLPIKVELAFSKYQFGREVYVPRVGA